MSQYCEIAEIGDAVNAATLLGHSEGIHNSHGGRNPNDDESTLPNYTDNSPLINGVIYKVDVLEVMNETRDWVDLDENCFDVCNIDEAMRGAENSRSIYHIVEENGIDQVGDEEENYVLIQVGDTVDSDLAKTLKVPDDWVKHHPNENKGEPHLSEVDNPDRWSMFSF